MILSSLLRRKPRVVTVDPRPVIVTPRKVDHRTPEQKAADQARLDAALGLR